MNKTTYRFLSVILAITLTLGHIINAQALPIAGENHQKNSMLEGFSKSLMNAPAQQTSGPRMLIPLYMYPSGNAWANVVSANTYQNIDVVINPSNGPSTSIKAEYVNGVNMLRTGGVGVFGYVYTGWGTRSLAVVKSEVDNWQSWYGVDGIFVDETANSSSQVPYYTDLWNYIHAKGLKVVLNPGTGTVESYAANSDSIVVYENTPSVLLSVPSWSANYPASKFTVLQYAASVDQMRAFIADAKTKNIGYIYVTDDVLPNPWDALPTYLAEEAALLSGSLVTPVVTQTAVPTATPVIIPSSTAPSGGASASNPCIGAPAPAQWEHVIVLMLENKSYPTVMNSSFAPYSQSVNTKCGASPVQWNDGDYKVDGTLDARYNSKPNYAVLTSGLPASVTGIIDNTYATQTTAESIYTQMLNAGVTFKNYYDGPAGGCGVRFSGDYHDPLRYYSNLATVCNTYDVPLSTFMTDVNSGNLPEFSMILPSNLNNMHDNTDASIATGDAWIANFLPQLLDSAEYAKGTMAVFVLWEENIPVSNVLIAPSISAGARVTVPGGNPISHYSALRTWQEMLGLPYLGNSAQAPSLLPFFGISGTVPPVNTAMPTFTPTVTLAPTITATSTTVASPSVPAGQNIVDIRVSSGMDDVEESATGSMYVNSSDLELIYDGNNQIVGIRFAGVNIPRGAAITNAYLQFKVDEISAEATTLFIQGEASPNALAFAKTVRNVSSRLRTAKSVSWTPSTWSTVGVTGTAQQTPNLAPVIQEIVNQPGWMAGNSMVMMITGNGHRVAKAYELDPAGAPLLHVEYTLASSSVTSTPTLTVTATSIPSVTATAMPTFTPTVTLPATPTSTDIPLPTATEMLPSPTSEIVPISPSDTPTPTS